VTGQWHFYFPEVYDRIHLAAYKGDHFNHVLHYSMGLKKGVYPRPQLELFLNVETNIMFILYIKFPKFLQGQGKTYWGTRFSPWATVVHL
jgi:hypothetical protein